MTFVVSIAENSDRTFLLLLCETGALYRCAGLSLIPRALHRCAVLSLIPRALLQQLVKASEHRVQHRASSDWNIPLRAPSADHLESFGSCKSFLSRALGSAPMALASRAAFSPGVPSFLEKFSLLLWLCDFLELSSCCCSSWCHLPSFISEHLRKTLQDSRHIICGLSSLKPGDQQCPNMTISS